MTRLRARHVVLAVLPFLLGGCQLIGSAGSVVGSILSVAIYLAAIAAPIILAYYLYHRHIL